MTYVGLKPISKQYVETAFSIEDIQVVLTTMEIFTLEMFRYTLIYVFINCNI